MKNIDNFIEFSENYKSREERLIENKVNKALAENKFEEALYWQNKLDEGIFNSIRSGIGKAAGALGRAFDSNGMQTWGAKQVGAAAGNKQGRLDNAKAAQEQAQKDAQAKMTGGKKPNQEQSQAPTQGQEQAKENPEQNNEQSAPDAAEEKTLNKRPQAGNKRQMEIKAQLDPLFNKLASMKFGTPAGGKQRVPITKKELITAVQQSSLKDSKLFNHIYNLANLKE